MRDLEQAAGEGDERADLALEIFAYRVRKYLGAYAAALGGLDAVAFTGGIGEHAPPMRGRICRGLEFLGLRLDDERNRAAAGGEAAQISADDGPCLSLGDSDRRRAADRPRSRGPGSACRLNQVQCPAQ